MLGASDSCLFTDRSYRWDNEIDEKILGYSFVGSNETKACGVHFAVIRTRVFGHNTRCRLSKDRCGQIRLIEQQHRLSLSLFQTRSSNVQRTKGSVVVLSYCRRNKGTRIRLADEPFSFVLLYLEWEMSNCPSLVASVAGQRKALSRKRESFDFFVFKKKSLFSECLSKPPAWRERTHRIPRCTCSHHVECEHSHLLPTDLPTNCALSNNSSSMPHHNRSQQSPWRDCCYRPMSHNHPLDRFLLCNSERYSWSSPLH